MDEIDESTWLVNHQAQSLHLRNDSESKYQYGDYFLSLLGPSVEIYWIDDVWCPSLRGLFVDVNVDAIRLHFAH